MQLIPLPSEIVDSLPSLGDGVILSRQAGCKDDASPDPMLPKQRSGAPGREFDSRLALQPHDLIVGPPSRRHLPYQNP